MAQRKPSGYKTGRPGSINPERLAVVRQMLSACYATGKIEHILSAEWKVSKQTIYNYIQRVFADLKAEAEVERPHRKERMRAAIEEQIAICRKAGAHSAATRAIELLGKIDGCFDPDKIEHLGPNGGPIQVAAKMEIDLSSLTDEELDVISRALVKTGG